MGGSQSSRLKAAVVLWSLGGWTGTKLLFRPERRSLRLPSTRSTSPLGGIIARCSKLTKASLGCSPQRGVAFRFWLGLHDPQGTASPTAPTFCIPPGTYDLRGVALVAGLLCPRTPIDRRLERHSGGHYAAAVNRGSHPRRAQARTALARRDAGCERDEECKAEYHVRCGEGLCKRNGTCWPREFDGDR